MEYRQRHENKEIKKLQNMQNFLNSQVSKELKDGYTIEFR